MSKTTSGKKRSADTHGPKSVKKAKVHKDLARNVSAPKKQKFDEEEQDEFDGLADEQSQEREAVGKIHVSHQVAHHNADSSNGKDGFLNGNSSREAHQKQKQLAQERKAAKPNSDLIFRTKKIWERLRIKSAVPKAEREKLVEELFKIITGRVKDFVFKHDSVRVIQCALKYATPAQKKQIAMELKGSYRELAESKYAKFLVAKLIVGDSEVRNMVVPEFYGHVKRLMRHPEASWIVDDIYRTVATKEQKARLLREWYGPEFVLDAQLGQRQKITKSKPEANEKITSELSEILARSPEKKAPIMQHLKEMTNQLVQKKSTGFTMLHDALLQYFINTKAGSPEANEFLEIIKDDEEGDLVKNLAFTKSGSRLVCLALAYGNSKDRRTMLKFFKTHIKLLSGDVYGHLVLLTAYSVIDDTVMSSKAIFPELLSKDMSEEDKANELFSQAIHLTARIPLLYLMSSEPPKWLLPEDDYQVLNEIKEIRVSTSKKDAEVRRTELLKAISPSLLDLITRQAATLAESSFGSQFIMEVLLGAVGDKQPALNAVALLATPESDAGKRLVNSPHAGRLFKILVQGGLFDKEVSATKLVDPPLKFSNLLFRQLQADDAVLSWALGPNAFTIVAMLETADFDYGSELQSILKKSKKALQSPPSDIKAAGTASRILLEKIGESNSQGNATKPKGSKKEIRPKA